MTEEDLRELRGRFPERDIGRRVFVSDSTQSTNDDARQYVERMGARESHGAVFLTLDQTRGRGTRGRTWWAPKDASLPMSVIVVPEHPFPVPAALTLTASLAVADVARACGATVSIRWPNDLVDQHGAKLCGILAEAVPGVNSAAATAYVIGIGINVQRSRLAQPPDLLRTISSLQDAGGIDLSRMRVAIAVFHALRRRIAALADGEISALLDDFNRFSWLAGKKIVVRRGSDLIRGTFLAMAPPLRVVIDLSDGSRSFAAEQLELVSYPGSSEEVE